ncbi:MAG TPA: hypothetical protein VK484_11460, partial [Ferruginibacter sp.]|nr:hypothetical protein [Ferruginibacter sp.]
CSVEYYEHRRNSYEQRIIYEKERKEYKIKCAKEQEEDEDLTLRELKYKARLNARAKELARNIQLKEEENQQIYLVGVNHGQGLGQRIITSQWKPK